MEVGKRPNASLTMPSSEQELENKAATRMLPSTTPSTKLTTGRKRKRFSALPIIRVIQIDTPKLVQTDIADFRSTVQNLTGNVSNDIGSTPNSCSAAEVVQCNCKQLNTPEGGHAGEVHQGNIENGFRNVWNACSTAEEKDLAFNSSHFSAGPFDRCSATWESFSDRDIITGLMIDSGEPLPDVTMLPPFVNEPSPMQGIRSAGMNATRMNDPWSQNVTGRFQCSLP